MTRDIRSIFGVKTYIIEFCILCCSISQHSNSSLEVPAKQPLKAQQKQEQPKQAQLSKKQQKKQAAEQKTKNAAQQQQPAAAGQKRKADDVAPTTSKQPKLASK